MRPEPRQLLRDVALLGPHGDLGGQAPFVERRAGQERLDSLAKALLLALEGEGTACGDHADVLAHGGEEGPELLVEGGAFRLAPAAQLRQRLGQAVVKERPAFLRGEGRLLLARDDAGLLEKPLQGQRTADLQVVADAPGHVHVRPSLRHVDDEIGRGRALDGRDTHADFDPAALDGRLDDPARIELERGQGARQLEGDVEVAVVERLALHGEAQTRAGHLGAAVPGHAADHRGL